MAFSNILVAHHGVLPGVVGFGGASAAPRWPGGDRSRIAVADSVLGSSPLRVIVAINGVQCVSSTQSIHPTYQCRCGSSGVVCCVVYVDVPIQLANDTIVEGSGAVALMSQSNRLGAVCFQLNGLPC